MTVYTAQVRTVYFLRPVGAEGPVKIGCTGSLERRREQVQCAANRGKLEIAAAMPGSLDDERRIHSVFWHAHIGREWFRWSRPLQLLIDATARGEADWNGLPPARVRPMPGRKGPWTEDQKLRAKYGRRIRKAEEASGQAFPHLIGSYHLKDTWKELLPEIEAFLEANS